MKPKRKPRHWWLVATRHGLVEEAYTMLIAAKSSKRRLDAIYTIHAPFRIIKVREVLAKRGKR